MAPIKGGMAYGKQNTVLQKPRNFKSVRVKSHARGRETSVLIITVDPQTTIVFQNERMVMGLVKALLIIAKSKLPFSIKNDCPKKMKG